MAMGSCAACGHHKTLYGDHCAQCIGEGRHHRGGSMHHRAHGSYAASPRLWSHKVETHYHPPAGLFSGSAEHIATVLSRDSNTPGQAIRRLNFYINRAGRNLGSDDKARLHRAVRILERKL